MPYFSYTQIQLGPIALYTWGLFLGLAFLIGYLMVLREAKKQAIEEKKIFWLCVFILLGGLLGARLGYLLQFFEYYLFHAGEILQFNVGGLMFYGGFFGALIAGWLYLKYCYHKDKTNCFFCLGRSLQGNDRVPSIKKQFVLSFLRLADILTPAIALGIFIARIGCSLINDHQGAITSLPWAIKWLDGTLRHPVAEYLALNGLIMFLVLWFLRTRLKKPGQLFIVFLLWYSTSRFFLDFTRVIDTPLADPRYWNLFISQWISFFIITTLFFVILLVKWIRT
jgi:phosphatidylglycerol:prolipoprotein diacylglycerol transferase